MVRNIVSPSGECHVITPAGAECLTVGQITPLAFRAANPWHPATLLLIVLATKI